MRMSKTTLSLATAAVILATPVAFAQSRDPGNAATPATGPSTGMTAAPPSARTDGTTMGRSDSVAPATPGGVSESGRSAPGTATGGPSGGTKAQN